jgi:hypothetical protein
MTESAREKRHAKIKKLAWEVNEPVFNILDYDGSMTKAVNFFNSEVSSELKKDWVIDYWKSLELDVIGFNKINESYFSQAGVLVRLLSKNYVLSESHTEYLNSLYLKFKESVTKKVNRVEKPITRKVTSTEKVSNLLKEICSELEVEQDLICISGIRKINVKNLLARLHGNTVGSKALGDKYNTHRNEFQLVLLGKDVQLKEAYSHFSKKTVKMLYDFCDEVCLHCEQTKRTAKTRKVKQKSAGQLTEKVKFMPEYADLNLKSISPTQIIGADLVFLFNTKLRKMFKYVASDGLTLTVKGTTILNFDVEKSGAKTIRKPENIKQGLGKREMSSLFTAIKSVVAKGPGRISEDMIIFAVFK